MRKNLLQKTICLILVLGMLLPGVLSVSAAGTKEETKRAISVVYDNSGSMYNYGVEYWCHATYALEVFACMMNEGDVLEVYPMNPILAGGQAYDYKNPLVIRSASDIYLIREMSTDAGNTHIESIEQAHAGLAKYGEDWEKWLIVLTDGGVFYRGNEANGQLYPAQGTPLSYTTGELTDLLSQYNNMENVMYLGIAADAAWPEINGNGSYQSMLAMTRDNQTYPEMRSMDESQKVCYLLTKMCNMIFGRDILPTDGKAFSIDIPMKKMIAFAQGENVTELSLSGSEGSGNVVSTFNPRYSETGTWIGGSIAFDLQGMIVTYEGCPAGDYTISCNGQDPQIEVYYEPDVDLAIYFVDELDNRLPDQPYAGEYYIQYGLVTPDGEFTESALLGNTQYEIIYYLDGVAQEPVRSNAPGKIPVNLQAGMTIDAEISVTYLSGYYIHKWGCDVDDNWPEGGWVVQPRPAGDLKLSASGGQSSVKLSQLEQMTPFDLSLTYENQEMTPDMLSRAEIQVTVEGGNLQYKVDPGDKGFQLKFLYNGSALETDCGDYTVKVTATYTTEEGQVATSNTETITFTVEDDSFGLQLQLQVPQNYYQISEIGSGQPLKAYLTKDGSPLTDEELAQVQFSATSDLPLLTQMLPGESAFEIRLDPEGSYSPGFYDIRCTADSVDVVGNPIHADGSAKVELQNYPLWLRWVLIVGIIGFIIFLIVTYLNTKILPKQIGVRSGSTTFNVDGSRVTGNARVEFSGKNKRNGSLSVTMPRCSSAPLAKGGFNAELVAVTPRKVKSAQRRAGIVSLTPINGSAVHTIQVGTTTFKKNNEGKFEKVGSKKVQKGKGNAVLFEIANNANCVISGETVDGTSFSCTCKLQFT